METFKKGGVEPTFPKIHVTCTEKLPGEYPGRFYVSPQFVPWGTDYPSYRKHRIDFVSPIVLENYPGWAHPPNVLDVPREDIKSYGELRFDEDGYPLNPVGRTGFGPGRGLLGKFGANFAADPIITYHDEGIFYLLVVERIDGGGIALPGGMCDFGESIGTTLARELEEETNVAALQMEQAEIIYQGYVDDWRNGDVAWMETTAAHRHLDSYLAKSLPIKPGSDAKQAYWLQLWPDTLDSLYANHGEIVRKALRTLVFDNPSLFEVADHLL